MHRDELKRRIRGLAMAMAALSCSAATLSGAIAALTFNPVGPGQAVAMMA